MPKTPLKLSPLILHAQNFWAVNLQASTDQEFGPGDISVDREIKPVTNRDRCWSVYLNIQLNAHATEKAPPYIGNVIAEGVYEAHPDYPNDPERLVRVTGSSMLYGVVRELVSTITARGPNGMVTLPSVSFVEETNGDGTTKKMTKSATKKGAVKAASKAK